MQHKNLLFTILSVFLVGSLASCGVDRWKEYEPLTELDTWMYDLMQQHYLWYQAMPSYNEVNPFAEPASFLAEVKASNDAYSFVDTVEAVPAPTYGFDYSLVRSQQVDTAYNALITYVIPNSPAEQAGLKRGDWIMKVDTFYISRNHEEELLQGLQARRLVMGKWGEFIPEPEYPEEEDDTEMEPIQDVVPRGDTLRLAQARSIADVPINKDTVLTLTTGEKVGYLMYNSFTAGEADNPEKYNDELREWSARMANEHVNKIILDLRYNAGGTMDCVQLLGTLLVSSYHLEQPMAYLEYNDKNTDRNTTLNFDSNLLKQGKNLDLNTLIVLISGETAGAPEMLMNSLNEKIQRLIAIGSSTKGQNVATERFVNEKHQWSVNPVVCTVYNSEHLTYQGYFQPTYAVSNASDYSDFLPFGNPEEALLKAALGVLEGTYPPEEEPDESEETDQQEPQALRMVKHVKSPASRVFSARGLQLK